MQSHIQREGNDQESPEWFENWFDSKYYHILYGNRDIAEAEQFMTNLLAFLLPESSAKIHDLACGKGRYSLFLNHKGFEVTGTDLSSESIRFARGFENSGLSFFQADMRQLIRVNYFDYVFNLFTSFGYFSAQKDNEAVMDGVHASLRKGGIFVLDYMNSEKMCKTMTGEGRKEAEGIEFKYRKYMEQGYLIKDIRFFDQGKEYYFQERVRAFSKADFKALFENAGFEILHFKGNYKLDDFDETISDRLIVIASKK
jgi:SAM-dependent methyltransferase